MSESLSKDLQTTPHGNMNDDRDLQPGEPNTCCICNDSDNSLDETDPDFTQLLLECLGLDHDNRVNIPEKVGDFGICFSCKILLEEWKFSRDQETKFRTRVRQLKATLTAKILESSGKDSSWLPSTARGKSWSHKLREIVTLNNVPTVQVKKYRSARDDEPYNNQVSSWHNNVHVAGSSSSSIQNAVNKEIAAIPPSPVQTRNPKLDTYSIKKTLSQRNINSTSRGSCDSGGAHQGSASMLIPNAECVQGPYQSLMAPALMMKNSCQVAGSGLGPIMNTKTTFIGTSYPPQPYVTQPQVPTFQVPSKNNFAGEIICCSSPSFGPSGVVDNTFVSNPYAPKQSVQAPCAVMPRAPALFPVQVSSYQNPPSFRPASSFPIMPTIGPGLFPVVANGPGGTLFVANGSGGKLVIANASRGQFPVANASGGPVAVANASGGPVAVENAPTRSQTSHTKFRPILPNPQNVHKVVSSSLNSGGQATEHKQTHYKTGTAASMPIYPLNMTAHLQQIVAVVTSSSQASNNVNNTETTTHTSAPTNDLVTKKKRKEPSGTSTRIPTKKANTQQTIAQTDQSHIYYNIRLDYVDGKYICGQCNRYFEGPYARSHSRLHVKTLHLGYPWHSQPVQHLGDDNNYMYGNKIPFRKYGEYFICGACETLISGKKPDSLIIQHILQLHSDILKDTTQDAIEYEDSNPDLMGQIKAEVDWETWTDESPENDYFDQDDQPSLTQDPFA